MKTESTQLAPLFVLLGRVFISELDKACITLLQEPELVNVFSKLMPEYKEYIFQDWNDKTQEDLASDYCHLFILPDRQGLSLKASHWLPNAETAQHIESLVGAYRNNHHHIDYLSASLPNDHLGVLLYFISHLHASVDSCTQVQANKFIELSLKSWIPDFVSRLLERTNNPIYYASAKLLLEII